MRLGSFRVGLVLFCLCDKRHHYCNHRKCSKLSFQHFSFDCLCVCDTILTLTSHKEKVLCA